MQYNGNSKTIISVVAKSFFTNQNLFSQSSLLKNTLSGKSCELNRNWNGWVPGVGEAP